jgi:hypothetical protein
MEIAAILILFVIIIFGLSIEGKLEKQNNCLEDISKGIQAILEKIHND